MVEAFSPLLASCEPNNGNKVAHTFYPDLATRLANDWVFVKTGKVDTLLFVRLQNKMVFMILTGALLICLGVILIGIWRKKRMVPNGS